MVPGPAFDPASTPADVAVIGAGGAGLLAGIAAAREGARTVVYERMPRPAKKVAISGGGRCNFSNALDPRRFIKLFGDPHAPLLGHALKAFSRDDLVAMLGRHGVEGQVERNYRLYTKSGRGLDVVNALVVELTRAGGALVTGVRVLSLEPSPEGWTLAGRFDERDGRRATRTTVICTGGLSYPATGSSGDGYDWARLFGHGVTDLRAALVGLAVEEPWTRSLQGLAWEDALVRLWPAATEAAAGPGRRGKPLAEERAEVLFTHFGISGPAILDVSNAFVREGLTRGVLTIDFLPDELEEALDAKLLDLLRQHPARSAAGALEGLLPRRLREHLERAAGAEGILAGQLPRAARRALLEGLKATTLTVTGTRGIEFGEVTAGGVEWDEIDEATLESRRAPGLYFAGEILDLAGRCGGFNLQAAFSTGYLAGREAARKALGARGRLKAEG